MGMSPPLALPPQARKRVSAPVAKHACTLIRAQRRQGAACGARQRAAARSSSRERTTDLRNRKQGHDRNWGRSWKQGFSRGDERNECVGPQDRHGSGGGGPQHASQPQPKSQRQWPACAMARRPHPRAARRGRPMGQPIGAPDTGVRGAPASIKAEEQHLVRALHTFIPLQALPAGWMPAGGLRGGQLCRRVKRAHRACCMRVRVCPVPARASRATVIASGGAGSPSCHAMPARLLVC